MRDQLDPSDGGHDFPAPRGPPPPIRRRAAEVAPSAAGAALLQRRGDRDRDGGGDRARGRDRRHRHCAGRVRARAVAETAPSLADSGEAVGGQISVAGGGGAAEAREEKGRFLFAGERPVVPACVLLVCDLSVSVLAEGFNLIDGLARSGLWGFCCCGRRRRRRYCFVLVWLGLLLCIRMFGALRGKATKLCQVASLQGCTLLLLLNFDHPFARPAWVASGTVLSWLYRSC